ncbi:MAG: extracellular solute-binding protein [Marinosulfonomonas sp.]|nr:extracellular solute-binding protein [Marinosulfonomonas sp.]
MRPKQAHAIAVARDQQQISFAGKFVGASFLVVALAWAGLAKAEEITITHGISTFGTLKYAQDFTHLDYVNPDAPKGGEISISAQGTFDSMNPYSVKGRAGALSTVFFEALLTGTADEIGSAYCFLCTTMEYPESKDWVIFNIRDDVTFSDGSPLTAQDVAFTYELFLEQGLPSYRAVLGQQVESAEVLEANRIKFTFKPDVPRRDLIENVGGLPVFSKAWFDSTGAQLDESRMEPAIGSGAYVLDSFDPNARIVYRRNPDYWGANHPFSVGAKNFDKIRVEYFGDFVAAFEGFKAGAYTFRIESFSKTWATQYDFPAIKDGTYFKGELPDGNMASGQSFVFNLLRPKFQDIRVRKAIAMMFNFEWSNESLFFGQYARINSFWENSELAAQGVPTPQEVALLRPLVDDGLLPDSILSEAAVDGPVSSARQLDRRNLRAASALLDEAGWPVGDDGKRRNDAGDVLSVEFLGVSPSFDRIVNPYVANLISLGIDAKLTRVDSAQYTARTRAKDFDITNDSFSMNREPGAGLKQYFGSAGAEQSVFNSASLQDPAVDRLIEIVTRADTKEDLHIAVKALDRVLRAQVFWVPQWYKDVHTVSYLDIYEHPDVLPPFALGYLDFWWLDPEKEAAMKAAGKL